MDTTTDCPDCGDEFDYVAQLSICPHVVYPPHCPECGGPTVAVDVDIRTWSTDADVSYPGTYRCAALCQANGRRPVEVTTLSQRFVAIVPGEPYGQ